VFETLGPLLVGAGHDVEATSDDPSAPRRAVAMARATARHRSDVDAVVVHLYSGRAFLVEDLVSRLAGDRPLVGYLSGGGFPAFGTRHPGWVRRVLDRFDLLVAPSPWLARWAGEATATPAVVVPNPLDLEPYPHRVRTSVRPRLLWLRAYHPIYAPEVAVRAAAQLADRHPDLHLTMAGGDKGERRAVADLARSLGLGSRIVVGGFAGPAAKKALFADHDVFVNSSRVDNRPVSVVEAAASGLCVVSTDVGGMPDLVEDGVSALLVPPDDPPAVAAAVSRLVDDPALAARISAGAREVAEAGRPEVVLAAWDRLLSGLVWSAGTPGPRLRRWSPGRPPRR
jgi:glycosyltransferase involved in cell wall biosynthesis